MNCSAVLPRQAETRPDAARPCHANPSRRRLTAPSWSRNPAAEPRMMRSKWFGGCWVSGRSAIWARSTPWRQASWCCCSAGPRDSRAFIPAAGSAIRAPCASVSPPTRTTPTASPRVLTRRRSLRGRKWSRWWPNSQATFCRPRRRTPRRKSPAAQRTSWRGKTGRWS